MSFASSPLPQKLSALPSGSAAVDSGKAWTKADGVPLRVRTTHQVTDLTATGGPKEVPVPADQVPDVASVHVAVSPTGAGYTPGLVLDVRQVPVVSDSATPPPPAKSMDVQLSYSSFRDVFAGDWGSRLQVFARPDCFLTTPEVEGCSEAVPVPAVNDLATETLTFTTADLTPSSATSTAADTGSGGVEPAGFVAAATTSSGTVYTASASATGGTGDYAAVPLQASDGWQVGAGSGEFSYSYPFAMPAPAVAGPPPNLGLNYSSGSVDGMTISENGQAPMEGLGWDMSPGYISRSYTSCAKDDPVNMGNTGDLCWKTRSVNGSNYLVDQLTLVLNGHSSPLIRIDGTTNQFRLQDDPGWKVTRITGSGTGFADNDDNDNEFFRVETPDGSTYEFGWGHGSKSVATVPVYGNDPGEPCHQSTLGSAWCQQGWRWGLDHVSDSHGNEIVYSYGKETNYYSRWGNSSIHQAYDRSIHLTGIVYGHINPDASGKAHSEVVVGSVGRCLDKLTPPNDPTVQCPAVSTNPDQWPDVPADLICTSTQTCTNYSPSFFSKLRYDTVTTERFSTTAGHTVDTYQLTFDLPDPVNGNRIRDLWLSSIKRTGHDGTNEVVLPQVTFSGIWLQNRVVVPTGESAFTKLRVDSVRNETGGRVDVVYGHAPSRTCDETYVTTGGTGGGPLEHYASERECFPRQLDGNWEWWHKYVVTRVALGDQSLGYQLGQAAATGPNEGRLRVYDYEYLQLPGWRYINDPQSDIETWDDWRGYERTIIHQRQVGTDQIPAANTDVARRTVIRFRGLDMTPAAPGAWRSESVTDSQGTYTDAKYLNGRTAEVQDMDPNGNVMSRTAYEYGHYRTASDPLLQDAQFVAVNKKVTMPRPSGHEHAVSYSFNNGGTSHTGTLLGAVEKVVDDRATPTNSSDDQTTCTDWSASTSTSLRVAYETKTYEDSTTCSGTLIGHTRSYYDNSPLGSAPTQGELSKAGTYAAGSSPIWTSYTYDGRGRVTSTSVPYTGGSAPAQSNISYNPTTGSADLLTEIQTTAPQVGNDPAMTTTTLLNFRQGAVKSVQDANGALTTITRDGLGRPLTVTYPENSTGAPSVSYTYHDLVNNPSYITTDTLRGQKGNGTPVTDSSTTYYDGWGRALETQIENQNSTNLLITTKSYDEQGLVWASASQMKPAGALDSSGLLNPDYWQEVPHWTRSYFDALGRPTQIRTNSYDTNKVRLDYDYQPTYDEVSTTGGGGTVYSTTRTDYNNRYEATSVKQYANGSTPDATGTLDDGEATYTYDPSGRLASIITPQSPTSNLTYSYTYDWLGRRLSASDPDTGTTSYTYDAMGNVTAVDDAMDNTTVGTLHTSYDVLGRPLERDRVVTGGATTALAEWAYDTAPNGKGLLSSATSHQPSGDFTTTINGYDQRGRVSSVTRGYPATITGEGTGQASVQLSYGYNQLDQVTSTSYSAVGDLPGESITTSYRAYGTYKSTTVNGVTLGTAAYDDLDRPLTLTSTDGSSSDPNQLTRSYGWDDIDRLTSLSASYGNPTPSTANITYDYQLDAIGNPRRVTGTVNGTTAAWCYHYDGINRLTVAKTGTPDPNQSMSCDAASDAQVTPVTGANYNLTYSYAQTRLDKVVADAGPTVGYTYPANTRPHAATTLTQTGTGNTAGLPTPGALTYDDAGRVTSWTPATGPGTTYSYDARGNLASSTDTSTGGATITYSYDDAGLRVARQSDNGDATVYIGNTEVVANGTTTPNTRRVFTTPGGTPLAIQDASGWTWQFADPQGTIRATRNTNGATTDNTYYPYGEPISSPGTLPAERGFLDKPHDPNGEIRLDHRNYDPSVNLLTTPDPILVPGDPQSANPYAYARNNPIAARDPSGLIACLGEGSNCHGTNAPAPATGGASTSAGDQGALALFSLPYGPPDLSKPATFLGRPVDEVTVGGQDYWRVYPPGGPCNSTACVKDYIVGRGGPHHNLNCSDSPGITAQCNWVNAPSAGTLERPRLEYTCSECALIAMGVLGPEAGSLRLAEEFADALAANAAADGDHIVLGLRGGLDETASKVGGRTLLKDPEWRATLQRGIADPSTKFTVSLDGMSGSSVYQQVMGAAGRGASGAGGATDWEMAQLFQGGRLPDVTFLRGGTPVENPWAVP